MQSILHIELVRLQMLGMRLATFLFPRLGVFPKHSWPLSHLHSTPPPPGKMELPEWEGTGACVAYLSSPILSLGCSLPVETTHFDLLLHGQVSPVG